MQSTNSEYGLPYLVVCHVTSLHFTSSCHSRLDDGEIRSLCGALAVVRLLVQTKISLDYYD